MIVLLYFSFYFCKKIKFGLVCLVMVMIKFWLKWMVFLIGSKEGGDVGESFDEVVLVREKDRCLVFVG